MSSPRYKQIKIDYHDYALTKKIGVNGFTVRSY